MYHKKMIQKIFIFFFWSICVNMGVVRAFLDFFIENNLWEALVSFALYERWILRQRLRRWLWSPQHSLCSRACPSSYLLRSWHTSAINVPLRHASVGSREHSTGHRVKTMFFRATTSRQVRCAWKTSLVVEFTDCLRKVSHFDVLWRILDLLDSTLN